MSITDELRKWGYGFCGSSYEVVNAIADRIDAEHQKALDEWRAKNGDMWLKGYAACHEELMEGHPVIAADLEKAGWVELPKDADGVPIRIGDELDYLEALHTDVPARFKVQDMFYYGNGKWHLRAYPATYEPEKCRHYHAPTVEDVMVEFAERWHNAKRGERTFDYNALVAEYTKRLTLAEGEDA